MSPAVGSRAAAYIVQYDSNALHLHERIELQRTEFQLSELTPNTHVEFAVMARSNCGTFGPPKHTGVCSKFELLMMWCTKTYIQCAKFIPYRCNSRNLMQSWIHLLFHYARYYFSFTQSDIVLSNFLYSQLRSILHIMKQYKPMQNPLWYWYIAWFSSSILLWGRPSSKCISVTSMWVFKWQSFCIVYKKYMHVNISILQW